MKDKKMAERLRKKVMDTKISTEQDKFAVTVNIGIATNMGDIGRKEHIIEIADRRCMRQKKGRNQSVLWKASEHQS